MCATSAYLNHVKILSKSKGKQKNHNHLLDSSQLFVAEMVILIELIYCDKYFSNFLLMRYICCFSASCRCHFNFAVLY